MKSIEIIITGANGGIGTALCTAYFNAGFSVIAIDIQDYIGHKYSDKYIQMDADEYAKSEVYRATINLAFKDVNPSVLINNCATQLLGGFEEFSAEAWHTTMNVNLSSSFFLIQAFYKELVLNKGQVINIGSIHANQTKPKFFAYATSKAALVGLTNALALEFKGKITVNAISPAAIDTPMLREGFDNDESVIDKLAKIHPSQEIGDSEDLAAFIFSITKANNRFLNGSNISFDGGISNALLDIDI